jgi:hypothetical protein
MMGFLGRNKWTRWVLGILIALLFFQIAFSENISYYDNPSQSPFYPKEKDPFIAGLLSWFMMGVGQIYVQEYTKGSLFIAADLVDKASLILLISHINKKYSSTEDGLIAVNWRDINTGTRALIVSYISVHFGLRLFCVIDAYKSAQNYNSRYFTKENNKGFSLDISKESISLGYSMQFDK